MVAPERGRGPPERGCSGCRCAGGGRARDGAALSLGGSEPPPASSTAAPYDYYQSVIGRYGPGFMMGGETDPGSLMGRLFADAPGPRVSPSETTRLGSEVPAGATADRAANRLIFTASDVHLVVLASPSLPAENFRIADMTNPTVVVPKGATVSIELVNADSDMAHGLVVTASGAVTSWMPMMSTPPALSGAALWFLGESTSAGMHTGTLTFTASTPGAYQYLCPVPGHAQEGMAGTFIVSSGS